MWEQEGMVIRKGTTLILTSGDYSDYGIEGLFKVLKDFDIYAVAAENTKFLVPSYRDGSYTHQSLLVFLTTNGFLEELHYTEQNMTDIKNIC